MAAPPQIRIDRGIPIAASRLLSGRNTKYPWLEMHIGDSFFVPHNIDSTIHASTASERMRANASQASRRYGYKFITGTVTEKGIVGTRVWRTE